MKIGDIHNEESLEQALGVKISGPNIINYPSGSRNNTHLPPNTTDEESLVQSYIKNGRDPDEAKGKLIYEQPSSINVLPLPSGP